MMTLSQTPLIFLVKILRCLDLLCLRGPLCRWVAELSELNGGAATPGVGREVALYLLSDLWIYLTQLRLGVVFHRKLDS